MDEVAGSTEWEQGPQKEIKEERGPGLVGYLNSHYKLYSLLGAGMAIPLLLKIIFTS